MHRFPRALWFGLPVFALLLAGTLFTSTGRDDTHITLWAAHSLSHFGAILNYNGDRVEQSSSLLHVLLLALLDRFALLPLVDLAHLASLLYAVATVLMVGVLVRKISDPLSALWAMLLTATAVYFVYWAFSGMETTLAACTTVLLVLLAGNFITAQSKIPLAFAPAVVAILLYETVRPEGPLLLLSALVVPAVLETIHLRGRRVLQSLVIRRTALLFLTALVGFGALIAFRLSYFGLPVPEPAVVKQRGLGWDVLRDGLTYLYVHLRLEPLVGLVALLAVLVVGYLLLRAYKTNGSISPYLSLMLGLCAASTAFIVLSGGDWMEGGRFLVPFFPLLTILVVLGARPLLPQPRRFALALSMLLLLQLYTLVHYAWRYSGGVPLWDTVPAAALFPTYPGWFEPRNRINVRDMPLIDKLDKVIPLIAQHKTPVSLMSGQMGMISFHLADHYYGQIKLLDRGGLVERALATCDLAKSQPRMVWGLGITYDFLFSNFDALEQQCGVSRPDILFDLSSPELLDQVSENGYTVIYTQTGELANSATFFKGHPGSSDEFIAVRNDLLPQLGNLKPTQFNFETLSDSAE